MLTDSSQFMLLLISLLLHSAQSMSAAVTHLPGFLPSSSSTLPFNLETGYVTVDEVHGVELFYYLIESEGKPSEDPLLLWLTGGPGCSALSALALEIGPLKFKTEKYNGSLPNLVYNPYAWTKFSSIIFLDSPVGTGFSFSHQPEGYQTGDKSWAEHANIFLRKWLADHPQYLSNHLYVAGDSYAGKVVPLVAQYLSNGNDNGMQPRVNLKGYIVGNPSTGEKIDFNSRVPFAHGMGIISDELAKSIRRTCKGENYQNPKNALCASHLQIFQEFESEIMKSHILEPKCTLASQKPRHTTRSLQDESSKKLITLSEPDIKCRTYAYYLMHIWANNVATKNALHVKKGTVDEWQRCKHDLAFAKDLRSSMQYHTNLTTRGYRALVYSGDHDMIVPFVGTKWWIRSLNFSVIGQWRSWHVKGQVAGYTVSYSNNLTFATVKNGGHTAPEYKPEECSAMARRWISQIPL
ncbi:Serine carboxypeptidase-like 18 [Apostasia shenzhenica]|uniref:Serine carboxypeptidase-like 18 n=1 Tax=Apostasia shenzhenica TaxID=1088818 RepID=A0A2I0A4F8_9ASPA|nr:Serine carboxypeptidase-like 18 [Apostasia shenzhenica]